VPLEDPTTCSDLDSNLNELLEVYEASHVVKPEEPAKTLFAVERPRMQGRTSSMVSRLPASPGTSSEKDLTAALRGTSGTIRDTSAEDLCEGFAERET